MKFAFSAFGKLITIDPTKIYREGRIRQDFGTPAEHQEFVNSIALHGIMQPPTVVPVEKYEKDTPEGFTHVLVAGGRRLNAALELKLPLIDVREVAKALNEIELRQLEALENLQRKDLSPLELAQQTKLLHDLLVEKNTKTARQGKGARTDLPTHTMQDTAAFLGISPASMTRRMQLATVAENDPTVAVKAKGTKHVAEALRKVGGDREKEIMAELTRRSEAAAKITAEPGNKAAQILSSYIVQDYRTADLPKNYFHLAEVDPPYAIGLDESASTAEDYVEIKPEDYPDFMLEVLTKVYSELVDDSWAVVWFSHGSWFDTILSLIRKAGFSCNGRPLIWHKSGGSSKVAQPEIELSGMFEMAFYAAKGRPRIQRQGRSNVFAHAPVPLGQRFHPAERPLLLMEDVLRTFAPPSSNILVPFAGSGKTIRAAYRLGNTAVGFDKVSIYRDKFVQAVTTGTL